MSEVAAPVSSVMPLDAVSRKAGVESTAREFEAVLAGELVKAMMSTAEDAEFGGGPGEDAFRGVLAEAMGSAIAKGGGIGVSSAVAAEMIRMQGEGK